MDSRLRFHPEVPGDLRVAIAWYQEISPQVAYRFRDSIDRVFDQIESHPLLHAVVYDDVRVVRTRTFPYLVHYRIRGQMLFVLGIFHGASDPAKWQVRSQS